jgi:hypothetical protein
MPLKTDLKSFVGGISEYAKWNHAEKVKFFAWYLHVYEKKDRINGADVAACYDALHDEQPSSIAPFLASMEKKNPKEAIRDGGGYYLSKQVRDVLDAKYGTHAITLNIRQKVSDLINKVPDIAEKDFMREAEICLRHDAGRATIIMVWNVAFYHLCQFVLKNHLGQFNAGFQRHYTGLWQQAKVKTLASYDDFSTLKESVVIDICKRENIINHNIAKILEKRLGDRNSAAHPSTIHVGQLQAEAFIEDIVDNVVLALKI